MNKYYAFLKIVCFVAFTFGVSTVAKSQIDTIPPKIFGCGDTIRIKTGSVFVLKLPKVTDNMTDSADLMVSSKWGSNGAVNTLVNGLYTLTITAFDTSGNVIRCDRYYLVGNFPSNIQSITSDFKFKAYPNPANSELTIQINEAMHGSTLHLFSANGQLVYETVLNQNTMLDTRSFSNGIYSILVEKNGQVLRQNLLIQH
jgi:hypothetical protein